tara:strand:+ start:490 stop:900 length:411 start_codon:yes stop_codon:yes gene_type:complete
MAKRVNKKYVARAKANQVLGASLKEWSSDYDLHSIIILPAELYNLSPKGRTLKEIYTPKLIEAVESVIRLDNPNWEDKQINLRARQATHVYSRNKWSIPCHSLSMASARWMKKIGWLNQNNGKYMKMRMNADVQQM